VFWPRIFQRIRRSSYVKFTSQPVFQTWRSVLVRFFAEPWVNRYVSDVFLLRVDSHPTAVDKLSASLLNYTVMIYQIRSQMNCNKSSQSNLGRERRHASRHAIYVTLRCKYPQENKFAPSLTEDMNPQSSHWKNWKMKIAYNSAYLQMETLNFTFVWQAIIAYFYLCSNCQ